MAINNIVNYYLVQIGANSVPARALLNGFDSYIVLAANPTDALAFVQATAGNAKQWANATVTEMEPVGDLNGWSLRVRVRDTSNNIVVDQTVTNSSATAAAAASGTVTFSSTGAANGDNITVNDLKIAYVTSGAVGEQINVSGVAATDATNLTAFINGQPDMFGVVATVAADVVTLTALVTGTGGNDISLVKTTGTNIAVSGSGFLSGGTSANKLSSLATLMATALAANGITVHAAWSSPTLTISSIADDIGDHSVTVEVLAPNSDFVSPTGVQTIGGPAIPGFVGTIVQKGVAGAALTAVLALDDYTVPTLALAAKVLVG